MYSICTQCADWQPNKEVRADEANPKRAVAICPTCAYEQPFVYLSLFIATGPSGAGKSTICAQMTNVAMNPEMGVATGAAPEVVVLESDILWGVAYSEQDEWPKYFNMWLRICQNIHQSGRSCLLFGAGLNPDNVECCPQRQYFSAVHYLALVCDEDELSSRLRARPQWRDSSGDAFIQSQIAYNRWFIEQGKTEESPLTILNTSGIGVEESVGAVREWVGQFNQD